MYQMANPHPHSLPPRWKPGQSGNPSGRPKGLAHYIQAQTRKGVELVDWYLGIWRGAPAPLERVPKAAERFEAAQWLSDRGWGRPPQYVDLALASAEIRRIEVTFDPAPVERNGSTSSMVVDVTPATPDAVRNQGFGFPPPLAPTSRARND
jgi:hypothetical protein